MVNLLLGEFFDDLVIFADSFTASPRALMGDVYSPNRGRPMVRL